MSELCYFSAREMVRLMLAGELSATELMQAHLDQIERVNPQVNALVSLNPEIALADARAADDAFVRGTPLGSLHGVPMAIKDTHLVEGFPATFGSRLRADHVPDHDELIVARLRRAGISRVGKTNVPEFAAGSHTFNEVFGVTRNPYDLTRSAGGSSGGAAASLATGMQPIADGSDMGGSLRNPAAFCNVVGLRPSPGRVPIYPSELPWQTLNVQGPMARSVDDVALMLSVIAGSHPRAPLSIADEPGIFAAPLEGDLTGLRVGFAPDFGGVVPVESAVRDVVASQAQTFTDLGCEVEEVTPDFADADAVFRILRSWQFHTTMEPLLEEHGDELKPSLAWDIGKGAKVSASEVAWALLAQGRLFQRWAEYFDNYDLLVLPVTQVAPFPVEWEYPNEVAGVPQESYLDWMRSCYLVSATGLPALSVPAGFTSEGLPVGMQLVGPYRHERLLLRIGHALETARGGTFIKPALT